jgi:hypothetical protein
MTSTIERLRAEDRKTIENAGRDYRSAVTLESNGGKPDIVALRAAMVLLGKSNTDFASDVAHAKAKKEDTFIAERADMAAAELPAIQQAREANRLRKEAVIKECDEQEELLGGQVTSMTQSIADGKAALSRLFDAGRPDLKADYVAIKAQEQPLARALADAESNLKIVASELDQAQIRVGNVEIGRGDGNLAELRAAVKPLEIKKAEAQRVVDAARSACDVAKAQTLAARQAVIES